MTMLRVCCGNERGDLDLSGKQSGEDGKKSYSCNENVRNYFEEYCAGGTIHGVRYMGERRTFLEKFFWAISLGLSFYFCISLMLKAYIRWENSPVIVSFATRETPVWMIPFPAVTICPESKTRPTIFNYTAILHKKRTHQLTPDEELQFGYLSYLCETKLDVEYTSGKFYDTKMLEFFEQVQPNFYADSFDCKYLGEAYNCSDLFKPVLTDDGICYSFNLMDRTQILSDSVESYKNFHQTEISHDWSIEGGYRKEAKLETYPRRALFAGVPYALEIKMKVHIDDLDYTCGTSVKGFKVQISHPQRMPRVKHQHFVVPLERVAKAGIAPDMMTTSQDVRDYKANKRNCHFPTERSLQLFSVYAQNNCAIECRANYTLSQCGCVPFYVPSWQAQICRSTHTQTLVVLGMKGTPICGAGSHRCVRNAIRTILRGGIQRKIDAMNGVEPQDAIPDCRCLPICTSMYYDIENTQANWDWRTAYKYNPHPDVNITDQKIRMSMLQVFFKGNQFINSERNELYGSTEFVANVGGLLGLFVGFSALSLVEIFYYLSLRIFCNVRMFGRRNWAGKTD